MSERQKYSSLPSKKGASSEVSEKYVWIIGFISIISLIVGAIGLGFGVRAWYLTPGGGGHGPTYNLKVSGELDQTGETITLYTTCSNDTGSVQVLQLTDGTIFQVYEKCPNPRNQCEMSLCDSTDQCTTALVDPLGCADDFDCESYQQCNVATCTCYNSTANYEWNSLWNYNGNDLNVSSFDSLTDPNSWVVMQSFWTTSIRGNETWVTMNSYVHYAGNSLSVLKVALVVLTSLPLPVDVANPLLATYFVNPGTGSARTQYAEGFHGYAEPVFQDADTIYVYIYRDSAASGVPIFSDVSIWVEYPTF